MFAFAHRFSYANCFGRLQVPIWKNRNERKHKCWTQTQFYYSRRASVKLTPQDVSLIIYPLVPLQLLSSLLNILYCFLIQVNLILNAKEFNKEFSDSVVKSYDSNQVASNNPLEDRRSEATCLYTNGERNWQTFRVCCFISTESCFVTSFIDRFSVWCLRWTRWTVLCANHLQASDAIHSGQLITARCIKGKTCRWCPKSFFSAVP